MRKDRNQSHYSHGSIHQRSECYDHLSESAVSNFQTISAIRSFLQSLIDRERFLCSEPEVSVFSQLASSVQGHSTSDRPVPPRELGWDGAARHASGAHLQGPTNHYISTGRSKDSKDSQKLEQLILATCQRVLGQDTETQNAETQSAFMYVYFQSIFSPSLLCKLCHHYANIISW